MADIGNKEITKTRNGVTIKFPAYSVIHVSSPSEVYKEGVDNFKKTSDHWRYEIKGETVEYYTGIGRRVFACRGFGLTDALDDFKKMQRGRVTQYGLSRFLEITKPVLPSIEDLFYSLIVDAQLGSEIFEDFCSELGLSTDSQKALISYEECQKSLITLRKIGMNIERLTKYFEDY